MKTESELIKKIIKTPSKNAMVKVVLNSNWQTTISVKNNSLDMFAGVSLDADALVELMGSLGEIASKLAEQITKENNASPNKINEAN